MNDQLDYINDLLEKDSELRDVCDPLPSRIFLLTKVQKIRDEVHELDKKTRMMAGILNKLHSTPPDKSTSFPALGAPVPQPRAVTPLLDSVRPIIQSCQKNSSALAVIIPPNQFWRWKDMWSISLRNAIYSAALVEYMTTRTLISLEQVSATLGSESPASGEDAFTHSEPQSRMHGRIGSHCRLKIIFML